MKTTKYGRRKLKKTVEDGNSCPVHGFGGLIL
jgi:hypothetical protein